MKKRKLEKKKKNTKVNEQKNKTNQCSIKVWTPL
jgi:hypothetical protein